MDKKIQVLPNSQNKINQENKKRGGSYQNGITCINSVWSSPDFIFQNSKKGVVMAEVLFAPDGKHYQIIKKGKMGNMWNYFNFNIEIRKQISLNPFAKFRLIGDTEIIIGELPR